LSKSDLERIKDASLSTIQSKELVFIKILLIFQIKRETIEAILPAPVPKMAVMV